MKNILKNREALQLASLFNNNGAATIYVYEPNGTEFQILRKYRQEGDRKGLKVLFDIAILGDTRKEYHGKDATTLAKVISGEAKSNGTTRAKRAKTAEEKVSELLTRYDNAREVIREVSELLGARLPKLPKPDKLDTADYLNKLRAEERTEKVQTATAGMSIEELLAEVARRQAQEAQE